MRLLTGTLGGSTGGVSGGSVHAVWADVDLQRPAFRQPYDRNGGAVYIESGTFTITGGAVSGNSAKNGGGIFAGEDGKVVLNGGAVSNNQAEYGGGVYTGAGTWFKLNGGEIINNTATENGGGVYCRNMYNQNDGRCQFYGGSISGNSAKNGGGAYAANNTQVGYRNCKISGNTATRAGAGFYLDSDMLYLGSVYPDGGGYICPYIYDNTVAGAQNNLYLSRKDAQIQFTQRIETKSKMKVGVYFTGITERGASVLLNYLLVERDFVAETYRKPFACDNPDYGRLESRKGKYYYDLYLVNTIPESTVTFDANGGTLTAGEETKNVKQGSTYGTLPVPKRTGYRFDGWFTEKDGGAKVEETTTVTSRENHTLYAHWTFIHEHCTCGGNIQTGDHTAHESAVYTAWNGSEAIRYTNNTAHVYLAQNATINSNLVVDGTTLYLCLSGNTLASNGTNKIQVKNGGRLVLCDCAGGGTIKGATKGWGGSCIYLYKSRLDMFTARLPAAKVRQRRGRGHRAGRQPVYL
ncbi:MAG: InlB B-repeat-containing protein [Acutalibacteraceae bacterium]